MKTNRDKLVSFAMQSKPDHPHTNYPGYWTGYDGIARILPSTGAITYNVFIGDSCNGLIGDHIEPGVSTVACGGEKENSAYNQLVCVGNKVRVIGSDDEGFVTGKHGGVEHVMVAFEESVLRKLDYNSQFLVEAYGQGMSLVDHEGIKLMNLDPDLFEKMDIEENDDGSLSVAVAAVVPAYLMGSGLGSSEILSGDYDIVLHDEKTVKEVGLDNLRFGDLVYISDHYCGSGPDYLKNAGTVGVVVHSDSYTSGHGPGVCVLMTAKDSLLRPRISDKANLKDIMGFKK